jgi:hypothetical protein
MISQLARNEDDGARADKYLRAAEENYERGKDLLVEKDYFVDRRDFDDEGNPTRTDVGEPKKSAPGEDNMSRVNARAYAFRSAAELYGVTGKESYRMDFERYFRAWIRDFYDPIKSGFLIQANIGHASDNKEIGSFKDPGGVDSKYDGSRGVKGNDGTIYGLAAILLQANEILGTEQTQNLVKEQLDVILNKFHRQNGMLWENYTDEWKPISVDWQSENMDPAEGESIKQSHVAIGGHTAMAPQQIIEGARQLLRQEKISHAECASYIDRALNLFQEFITVSGAIEFNMGAVHNGIRVEEPRTEHRWIQKWDDAGWQQAELIQTLLRLSEEGVLNDIKGPGGKTGEELLKAAERYYLNTYAVPGNYSFVDFGNPDVYHRPQLALYHYEVTSKITGNYV